MKIVLVSPSGAMHRFNGLFSRSLHYAPLTLTTLAALVPPELEADIEIYDESVERIPLDLSADLVGITAITGTSPRAYRLADHYRANGLTVVIGGVHPTLMPEEAALHADAVVVGYAEQTWPQLLRDFSRGRMRSRYDQPLDFTMAGRPFPRRDLLLGKRYITTNSVEASRGCLHSCNFCVVPAVAGQSVHVRPVREVVAEVEALPGKEVVFVDVNLIADPRYARQLFAELAPLRKWWFGLVTTAIAHNDELFRLMAASGCRGVLIGFESVTTEALASINKPFNRVAEYRRLVNRLHDAGIAINGTFVLGTDGDDRTVFERTVEVIDRLSIDLPRYSVMTPFPGTPLFSELARAGRIIERDWSMYDVEHCVISPRHMTAAELDEGLEWAWRQTYSVGSIARRLLPPSRLTALNVPLNLGYRSYARKLHRFPREVMVDHNDIPAHEEDHLHTSSNR